MRAGERVDRLDDRRAEIAERPDVERVLAHSAEVAADDHTRAVARERLHVSRVRVEAAIAIHQILLDIRDVQYRNTKVPVARVLADRTKRLVSRDVADDGHDPVG